MMKIYLTLVIFLMSGCINRDTSHDLVQKYAANQGAERFRFVRELVLSGDYNEVDLIRIGGELINDDNVERQELGIAVLFWIVEPDQTSPPKIHLVRKLMSRFQELHMIHEDRNTIGICSEKFIYQLTE